MKNNPFIKESIEVSEMIGRKDEIWEITAAIDNAINGKPSLLVLTGARGIGKTFLLQRAEKIAARSRCLSVYLHVQRKEKSQYILKRLLEEMYDNLKNMLSQKIIPLRFERVIPTYREEIKNRNFKENATEEFLKYIKNVCSKIKENVNGIAFFIDNIENSADRLNFFEVLIKICEIFEKQKIPCLFVLSASSPVATIDVKETKEAFRIIKLIGLTEHESRELIEKLLKDTKITIGEECIKSIIEDCEGYPAILLTVCRVLFDKIKEKEKQITKGHYLANSNAIIKELSREVFDSLYEQTSLTEREILKIIAYDKANAMHVSAISRKMKKPLGTVTRLVLRLLESGNLIRIERGKYKIFNRLYGKYVLVSNLY